ncbi:hypothetical protein [Aquabacterium sp.]|uniref:hypothetical protein n=1 Tax=Aquabacterium sp. TaxID=1872578 RepID=UPI004037BCD7
MFKNLIAGVYLRSLRHGARRIDSIEQYLGVAIDQVDAGQLQVGIDAAYSDLFNGVGRVEVEGLYDELRGALIGKSFEQCADILDGLSFLQELVAMALWKYQVDVGERLEGFARNFDRLDVQDERRRLHQEAQLGLS